MNVQEEATKLLVRTRELIVKGWTQGAYARRSDGSSVGYRSVQATCWCLSGAINEAHDESGQEFFESYHQARSRLKAAVGYQALAWFNDARGRTKAEVVAAIDEAIQQVPA